MKQLNWYQIFGNVHKIPDGRTVEPTDDIQIWLNCANIWDKSYTTLAEVLADTDTLLALISSNNAVDYMVRSTTWAVPITVPKMTSNTTPEGVASCDKNFSQDPAWHAFDQDTATQWSTYQQTNPASGKIRYQFTNPVAITSVTALIPYDGGYRAKDYKVNASNDGITYQTLASGTFTSKSVATTETITFSNTDNYLYWELEIDSTYSGAVNVKVLQFYSDSITTSADAMTYIGQNNYASNTLLADATWREAICNSEYFESVLNVKVPVMTSNTTPSGECYSNSEYSASYKAYMAFDNNASDYWFTANGFSVGILGYKFENAVNIYCAYYLTEFANYLTALKFQGSTDGVTYVDLCDSIATPVSSKKVVFTKNISAYTNYQVYTTNGGGGHNQASFKVMQFYGRKDI